MDEFCLRIAVESLPSFRSPIVVLAHRANHSKLAIDIRLIRANVPDDLFQLCNAIPIFRVLEPGGVNNKALGGELHELVGSPFAKEGGLL